MRSILSTVLTILCVLLPVLAVPGITPDVEARDDSHFPKPSKVHYIREPHPSSKPGHPYAKRDQEALVHTDDFSEDLCPFGMTACPVASIQGHTCSKPTSLLEWIRQGFECTDVQVDLDSCGGCGSIDPSHDCMSIPGALGVSCLKGECHIDFCQAGFRRSLDGKSCLRAI